MATLAVDSNRLKRKNSIWTLIKGTDFVTMLTALSASIYGLMLVYSASYSSLSGGRVISSDVRSMLVSIIIGFVISIAVSNIDYDVISKLWPIIAAGCVGLMIFTFSSVLHPNHDPIQNVGLTSKSFIFNRQNY